MAWQLWSGPVSRRQRLIRPVRSWLTNPALFTSTWMWRDTRLQRDVERRRQLADQQRLAVEPREDRQPHRVGKRPENEVEGRRRWVPMIASTPDMIINIPVDSQL